MYESFTIEARKAIVEAQSRATSMGHNYISTEHILLGLIDADDSIASEFVKQNITVEQIEAGIRKIVNDGGAVVGVELVFTPRAKSIIELAFGIASDENSITIGTKHLLKGLIKEGQGIGYRVLQDLNFDGNAL